MDFFRFAFAPSVLRMWIWQSSYLKVFFFVLLSVCILKFFSATNALTGDGLQEGVDWLQGIVGMNIHENGESGHPLVSSSHSVVHC